MIIVNTNEPQEVKDKFKELGIAHKIEHFMIGDFTNEAVTFYAERKGFNDFWSSMTDGRMYEQLEDLHKTNLPVYIFVESGSMADWAEERKKNTNWIYSMFGEAENWGVNFREYVDLTDLARKLVSLDKKLDTELRSRKKQPKLYGMTCSEQILSRIPSVGQKKAKSILKQMDTLENVFWDVLNNDGQMVLEVFGIGEKIIQNIWEALTKGHVNV